MAGPSTLTVWITRQRTTVRHLRGLLEALDQEGVADLGEVKIMAVSEDRPVEMSAELMAAVTGDRDAKATVFTVDNLPPQGVLWIGTTIDP